MVMRRKKNWPLLLSRVLQAHRKMAFDWGTNDCLLMPADAVLEITGIDPASQWRGTYSTRDEALALLEKHGGVEGIITEGLGIKGHNNIMEARRGDVAMVFAGDGMAGGIVDDSGQYVIVQNQAAVGTLRIPLTSALKIWSY